MAEIQPIVNRAWDSLLAGDLQTAMMQAKEAHQLSPNSDAVQHVLGLIASRQGQHEIALSLLQQSINAGKTERKLRDMTEALFSAGFAEEAQTPLDEALHTYGKSSALCGLQSAISIDLGDWPSAESAARNANELDQFSLAWDLNLSFSALMQQKYLTGFQSATSRDDNLQAGARCPALHLTTPSEIWLKSEQGLGDTLYYLRYVQPLLALGWTFHLEVEEKLVSILSRTSFFLSVSANNPCPLSALWLNVGDLALAAMQCGIDEIPEPLPLTPDPNLVMQFESALSEAGPPPYVAVSWQGGPKGSKQKNGIRLLDKNVPVEILGHSLSAINATVINIQRLPTVEATSKLNNALGYQSADFTNLNENLDQMLALLSIADHYVTVSNTNLHLRESLAKPSYVLVSHPFQDWRWLTEGGTSPWYPNSQVYRQNEEKNWQEALNQLEVDLISNINSYTEVELSEQQKANTIKTKNLPEKDAFKNTIDEGWAILPDSIPEAIQKAQIVLAESPEHARALHLLGWAAVKDFKFDIGVQVLQQATNANPQDGIVWRDYIRCLALNNQTEEALSIADKCLERKDVRSKSAIHYAKAGIYFKVGKEQEALIEYDKCREISPNNLDALSYAGMVRMKMGEGHAMLGFKQYSARPQASQPHQIDIWCSPILRGDIKDLEILITYDMGLGDELSYLRYMPWLIKTGAKITYWCGAKLEPLLKRLNWPITLIPSTQDRPNPNDYSLSFIVNELPAAVEHFGAPDVAPSLILPANPELVRKWRKWLAQFGKGPFVGINWRSGAASADVSMSFSKLAKAIPSNELGESLKDVDVQWVSLQRNVTQHELDDFAAALNTQLIDAAGESDELDDMLALLSLLDGNVGVSNTNMHLRAALGLGSDVLVQAPGGDWRWGIDGSQSSWFEKSTVYRQSYAGEWHDALSELSNHLIGRFGKKLSQPQAALKAIDKIQPSSLTKRIIWLTAGHIEQTDGVYFSQLSSAQERVINPANALKELGWHSDFVNEGLAEAMGGWQGHTPKAGDIVVVSKVVTQHALKLITDAKARGAYVVVDVFNDFSEQPTRENFQYKLMAGANAIVSIETLSAKWSESAFEIAAYIPNSTNENSTETNQQAWDRLLNQLADQTLQALSNTDVKPSEQQSKAKVLVGMMYSGENEYQQALEALNKQTHQSFELIEVKNLQNKEAHDTLYAGFMARHKDFDFFLKLDADMVFAHEQALAEMVQTMVQSQSANILAYVKDCPSGLMIPGIQMFKSDTQWLGSDEELNVDYVPKLNGKSLIEVQQNWILHMPNPSKQQLFRYGVHKALKALQPNQEKSSFKKAILHINILAGINRNLQSNPDFYLSLIGSTMVFTKQIDSIQYNGEVAQQLFERLDNEKFYLDCLARAKDFWRSEIQVFYRWIDLFNQAGPKQKQNKELANQAKTTPKLPANQKRIVWLTAGKLDQSRGFVTSDLASTRYRVLLPAANLGPLGWQSQIVNENDLIQNGWSHLGLNANDVVIVSKTLNPKIQPHLIEAKESHCKIVVDFCDNYFSDSGDKGEHFNNLLSIADVFTTCSEALTTLVQGLTDKPVKTITDCFEGTGADIKLRLKSPVRLLWFGSYTNLASITPYFSLLRDYAKQHPVIFDVVTWHPDGHPIGHAAAKNESDDNLKVNYLPWSSKQVENSLDNTDIVLIPTVDDQSKSIKSPNRVIEAIWAGRYVVAGKIPAYEPFAPFASITNDLIGAIDAVVKAPNEAKAKIKLGKEYILQNHTPKLIGELWHSVISSLSNVTNGTKLPKVKPSKSITAEESTLIQYCQLDEIIRLNIAHGFDTVPENAVSHYLRNYPITDPPDSPKVAVYTAIFGEYDDAPIVTHIDENIDYILYTDNPSFIAHPPWEVRVVPAIFEDPQVDARRVKLLSHQFLVNYDITVWIDGNLQLKTLDYALICEIASRAPIALCKHQFRSCIYQEMNEVLRREIDASKPVLKQNQYYRSRKFPKETGLHATSFLVRNHLHESVAKFNMRWWELLSQFSKRDQLSFDYVRWEQSVNIMPLPFNLRDNDLYYWGADAKRGHKSTVRRNDEQEGRKLKVLPNANHGLLKYNSENETWPTSFLSSLFELNLYCLANGISANESPLYPEMPDLPIFSTPDPRLANIQSQIKDFILEKKNVLIIGDELGHSVLLSIVSSNVNIIHAVDNRDKLYEFFKSNYPNRYQPARLENIDSTIISALDIDGVILFVSDSSEQVKAEINSFTLLASPILKIVASDAQFELVEYRSSVEPTSKYVKSLYGVWLKRRIDDLTWRFAISAKYGYFYSDYLENLTDCIFIDIGANVGLYSLIAQQNENVKSIYSFEPHPETYQFLSQNIDFNQADKCKAYQLAIADASKKTEIRTKRNHSGVATMRKTSAEDVFDNVLEIESIGADELNALIQNPLNLPISIKVDVEGLELSVLTSLLKANFSQQIKSIYYEVDESYLDYKKVKSLLIKHGFQFYAKNGMGQHYDLLYIRQ